MKYYTFLVFGSFLLNVFQNFDRQEIFEKKKEGISEKLSDVIFIEI
jgi:hypothetical protein